MKRHQTLITVFVSAALLVSAGSRAFSQPGPNDASQPAQQPPADMPDMQAMMQKWLAAATPGPKHKLLDAFVGEWETTSKMWMGGPGSEPVTTKGSASIKWVLDGRFLLQEFNGETLMPDAAGQMKPTKHTGIGLTGHDNYRNMYVASWTDNLGTQMLTMSGMADPSGKVLTFYGEMDEPMLDVRGRTVKYVTRAVDKDHFVFEVYDLHAGDGYKVVEVEYRRRPA